MSSLNTAVVFSVDFSDPAQQLIFGSRSPDISSQPGFTLSAHLS